MKICILSMQHVRNFGSVLQSFALKKMIEDLGHEVCFIDIQRREEDDRLMINWRQNFGYETQDSSGLLNKIKKFDRQVLDRIRAKIMWEKQGRILERFRKNNLNISEQDNKKHFDVCVIGSDEVFNCLSFGSWGFTTQLFGNVEQAARVITYAASCGSADIDNVPIEAQQRIKSAFKRFEVFSVRDKNTEKFVRKLTEKEIVINWDPVLVGDFEKDIEDTVLPKNIPENYCIVYSYFNRINKIEDINAIKAFCKKYQLEIIGVGAPQLWIKKNIALTPFQAIRVFQNAKFVITDTFHGAILATRFCGRFAVMVKESNRNKLGDLIERLHITEHKIEAMCELERVYCLADTKSKIEQEIIAEKSKSISYIKNSIQKR